MSRTQLADAMLRGVKTEGVEEHREFYIHIEPLFMNRPALCMVCAMGGALVGYYDGNYKQAHAAWREATKNQGEYDAFADLLDIDPALAIEIEHRHLNGQTIEQIAAWLKGGEQS